MQQLRKMGFVRCGIFHIPMNSESLENAGILHVYLAERGKASRFWCVIQRR